MAHSPLADGQWVLNISQPFALKGTAMIRANMIGNVILSALLLLVLILGGVFVRMTLIRNIINSGDALEEANAILCSISQEVESLDKGISSTVVAVEQITANVGSMDNQIIDQSAMVQRSTAAITQMIASLGNVRNITKAKQRAKADLTNVTEEGKKQISATSETFRLVVQNIEAIQEMAEVINGIASQTDLLSMNAAIEAAHIQSGSREGKAGTQSILDLTESVRSISLKVNSGMKEVANGNGEILRSMELMVDLSKNLDGIGET